MRARGPDTRRGPDLRGARLIACSKEPGVEWLWCYVDEVLVEPEIP